MPYTNEDALTDLGFTVHHDATDPRYLRVTCDQCAALVINGHPTHETGCPNGRRYPCRECGCTYRDRQDAADCCAPDWYGCDGRTDEDHDPIDYTDCPDE